MFRMFASYLNRHNFANINVNKAKFTHYIDLYCYYYIY